MDQNTRPLHAISTDDLRQMRDDYIASLDELCSLFTGCEACQLVREATINDIAVFEDELARRQEADDTV